MIAHRATKSRALREMAKQHITLRTVTLCPIGGDITLCTVATTLRRVYYVVYSCVHVSRVYSWCNAASGPFFNLLAMAAGNLEAIVKHACR